MAEQLFTVAKGYAIEDEITGDNSYENFSVVGVPSSTGLTAGDLTLSDNAPIGSKATDSVTGFEYRKKTVGAGETTWVRSATVDDITLANNGESWREPAQVKDDSAYATKLSAETAVNTGTIDGVVVAEGDRILFTDITGENSNVYIVTGVVGAGATLVEDTNAPSHNDTLMIDKGSSADTEFHYSDVSNSWVNSGANGSNEDGFQNNFVGKAGTGSSLPQYTSTQVVANNDSIAVAIGKLDFGIDVNQTAINGLATGQSAMQLETDAMGTSLGMVNSIGNYQPRTTTNYIDANSTVDEDLTDLDTQVKANADAISAQGGGNTELGVTALVPVDTVLVDDVKMVRWMVHVQQGNKVTTYEVDATHDGTAGADATDTDCTKYARLKMNGNISGLKIRCAVTGSGATQKMELRVQANSAVDVSTTRVQVL